MRQRPRFGRGRLLDGPNRRARLRRWTRMAPQTGTALLVLAAFVLPGFVTLMIGERTHLIKDNAPTFDRLLYALYYSSLVYGLLLLFVLIVLGWHRHDVTDLA